MLQSSNLCPLGPKYPSGHRIDLQFSVIGRVEIFERRIIERKGNSGIDCQLATSALHDSAAANFVIDKYRRPRNTPKPRTIKGPVKDQTTRQGGFS